MATFFLFAVGIILSSLGAIFLKLGGGAAGAQAFSSQWFLDIATNKFVILGFIFYFVPALIWVHLLSKLPVTVVHPIIALTYSITPILAIFLLKEPVSPVRWLGILVTVVGIIIVSRS